MTPLPLVLTALAIYLLQENNPVHTLTKAYLKLYKDGMNFSHALLLKLGFAI